MAFYGLMLKRKRFPSNYVKEFQVYYSHVYINLKNPFTQRCKCAHEQCISRLHKFSFQFQFKDNYFFGYVSSLKFVTDKTVSLS